MRYQLNDYEWCVTGLMPGEAPIWLSASESAS